MPPKMTSKLPQNWKMLVDPRSGRAYYANTVTGKTQWETPQVSNQPTQDKFIKMYDSKSNRYYWANLQTGKTQWNDPNFRPNDLVRKNASESHFNYSSKGGQKLGRESSAKKPFSSNKVISNFNCN